MKDATTNDPVKGHNATSRTFPRSTSSRLAAMARAFSSKTQAPDPVPPRAFMAGGVSPEWWTCLGHDMFHTPRNLNK